MVELRFLHLVRELFRLVVVRVRLRVVRVVGKVVIVAVVKCYWMALNLALVEARLDRPLGLVEMVESCRG